MNTRSQSLLAPFLAPLLAILSAPCLAANPPAAQPRFLEEGKTILFLGDSITQGGTYIAYIDAWLYTNYPSKHFEIIGLGLSSETASGLTETDHPFPRPCIHERLDRALATIKPDVTFACYGMNDGIYHPLSEERFAAYREGMSRLIAVVKASGSKVILLTPPPFDAETMRLRDKPLYPSGADDYGYKTPYEKYDEVLAAYSRWALEQAGKVDLVIDVHTPMEAATARKRAADPSYQSGDGIHPNALGHYIMARSILKTLDAPGIAKLPDYAALPRDHPLAAPLQLIQKRRRLLDSAWREHVGHKRPGKANALPLDEALARAAELDSGIRETLRAPGR